MTTTATTTATATATAPTVGLRSVLVEEFDLACCEWAEARLQQREKDTPAHRAAVAEWTDRIDAVLDVYLDVVLAA
jgi:hypothetical protein